MKELGSVTEPFQFWGVNKTNFVAKVRVGAAEDTEDALTLNFGVGLVGVDGVPGVAVVVGTGPVAADRCVGHDGRFLSVGFWVQLYPSFA